MADATGPTPPRAKTLHPPHCGAHISQPNAADISCNQRKRCPTRSPTQSPPGHLSSQRISPSNCHSACTQYQPQHLRSTSALLRPSQRAFEVRSARPYGRSQAEARMCAQLPSRHLSAPGHPPPHSACLGTTSHLGAPQHPQPPPRVQASSATSARLGIIPGIISHVRACLAAASVLPLRSSSRLSAPQHPQPPQRALASRSWTTVIWPFSTTHFSLEISATKASLCETVTTAPLKSLSACVSAASVSLSR